jgi:hypothetical protein
MSFNLEQLFLLDGFAMALICFALVALIHSGSSAEAKLPLPPYRRAQTVVLFEQSFDPPSAMNANWFFTANQDHCCAYDLATMKRAWQADLFKGEWVVGLEAHATQLWFVTKPVERGHPGHFGTMDSRTGKVLWSGKRTAEGLRSGGIRVDANSIYLSLAPLSLSCVDAKTHKTRWTTKFPASTEEFGNDIDFLALSNGYLLTNCGTVTYCLDLAGKVLWHEPQSYILNGQVPCANGVAWVPSGEGSQGRDIKTGKILWRSTIHGSDFRGTVSGRFVGLDKGSLVCLDPKTSHQMWSVTLGPGKFTGGHQTGAVIGSVVYAVGESKAGFFDANGKVLLSQDAEEAMPQPIWSDGKAIVCFDGSRLVRYVHGASNPIPTDSAGRKALAEQMMARYDQLDAGEVGRLTSLKDDAFEAILKRFVATWAAHDNAGEKAASFPLYSKAEDLGRLLMKVTGKSRTKELMQAIDSVAPKSSAKPMLLGLLGTYGDPAIVTPYFLRELEGVKTPGFEMYESNTFVAREYIVNSKDPRAVAFMLKQLKDPKADEVLRFEAYLHLAGTGGEEGLRAVLAERNRRALLRPISERATLGFLDAGEFGKQAKPIAEKTDTKGRTWSLIESGVLGSSSDLWLAQKEGGKWAKAWFTGTSRLGPSRWVKNPPPAPKIGGKTGAELLAGAWFATLVDNPEIPKDSDGDGLTDIEEARLGTDPNKADTDGDGDPDGTDPWPNAPSRSDLGDAEKVLAAAFEARYHFDSGEGVGIFFAPKDLKPFEMAGRRGTMVWLADAGRPFASPLEQCYEQGVAFISFGDMDRDPKKPWTERLIRWNADRTEARIMISTYFGGLNGTGYEGTVRKFGNEWVVTAMRQAYVS